MGTAKVFRLISVDQAGQFYPDWRFLNGKRSISLGGRSIWVTDDSEVPEHLQFAALKLTKGRASRKKQINLSLLEAPCRVECAALLAHKDNRICLSKFSEGSDWEILLLPVGSSLKVRSLEVELRPGGVLSLRRKV